MGRRRGAAADFPLPELAEHLGVDVAEASGQPLTRAMRLIENESGEMPLISALAGRRAFTGQKACSRSDDNRCVVLSGEVVTAADGRFAGFRGAARYRTSRTSKGRGLGGRRFRPCARGRAAFAHRPYHRKRRADRRARGWAATHGICKLRQGHRRRGPPPSLGRALDERGSGAWPPHNRSRRAGG